MKRRDNKTLYEQIMNGISTEVRHALNELSPDVYRRAADKREAQIKALPTKLRNMLGVDKNAPADLRAHANKIENEERDAAKKEAVKRKKLRTRLKNKLIKENSQLFNNKEVIKYYSQLLQYISGSYIDWSNSDKDIIDELESIWGINTDYDDEDDEAYNSSFREADEGGFDYEMYSNMFDKFNDLELNIIGSEIIPNIIKTSFNKLDLIQCCYIEDAWRKEIIVSDKDRDRLENKFGIDNFRGVYIYVDDERYLYYKWGELVPISKLGFKHCLSGDFRGEVDEVIDLAESYDCTVIQYPKYLDCIVLSNSKRALNAIENNLWDSHIMACGGVGTF